MLSRVALITVLLIATVVFNLQDDSSLSDRLYVYLYNLCTIVYVLSFLYTIGVRLAKGPRGLTVLIYAQFTGDILFAAALVLVTGGTDSAFTFFFSLVIIGGAIITFRLGALYIATLASFAILLIGLVEVGVLPYTDVLAEYQLSFLPGPDASIATIEEGLERNYRMVYNVSVNVLAFYGVALLASWLSEQVRRSVQEMATQTRSLADLRALHRHIVSSIPVGLVTTDLERRITYFNTAAEHITDQEFDVVAGQDITTVFRDLKFVMENPHKLTGVHREESVLLVGRRRRYIGWTLSWLRDASGDTIGHTFMFQDITRVKDLEKSNFRTERMAAVGELAAAVAHEIRNPLAAISGSIQMLQRVSSNLSGTEKRLMDIVVRETDGLNQWITDFLEYSRPQPANRAPVDIDDLVTNTLAVYAQDPEMEGITVEKTAAGPMWILADAGRIRQVVWNLLNNARQAMTSGGTIRVGLLAMDNGSCPLMELSIQDEGVGVSEEVQERIFEPFYTTKDRGTGLGLAVVHQVIEDHDGQISLESEEGVGTTFRVLLPLSLPPV